MFEFNETTNGMPEQVENKFLMKNNKKVML